jgi:flagellar hook protein FlgE
MYSAVSGLQSHQTKMDVVGNNIANVNTYGYKANRATFADVFYTTRRAASSPNANQGGTNPSQLGYGSKVSTIDVLHTRAGAATTGRTLDVYINGDGFIAVKTADGQARYTRAGALSLDSAGNLVDRSGNMVLGLPMKEEPLPSGKTEKLPALDASGKASVTQLTTIKLDPNVEYTGIEISTKGEVTALRPGANVFTPSPNTGWMVSNAQNSPPNTPETAKSPLADSATYSGEVRMTVKRDSAVTPNVNVTAVYTFDKSNTVQSLGTGFPTTSTDLKLNAVTPELQAYLDGLGLAEGETRDIVIGNINAGTSTPEMLGQLAIVTFENQDGLEQIGEEYFGETVNSGAAEAYVPGRSGTGSIMAGALEMSNVDLSREFTEMIITERGFQANTRMVTVSDEMLQELINMKR